MNTERKARIANGSIIFVVGLLAMIVDHRFIWFVAIMGISLIFSGVANYCGFAKIFDRLDGSRKL